MFHDSELVQTFTCGGDKTASIAKFGLAEFIKRELVLKINKGPHVRFWDEGKVQSRYLGSEFMGHATAQYMLTHIKVSNVTITQCLRLSESSVSQLTLYHCV